MSGEFVKELVDKTAKVVNESVNYVGNKVSVEKNKLDIKNQINQHEKNVQRAYERLGKAYYNSIQNHDDVIGQDDLIEMINTNKKVIELLNNQLNNM